MEEYAESAARKVVQESLQEVETLQEGADEKMEGGIKGSLQESQTGVEKEKVHKKATETLEFDDVCLGENESFEASGSLPAKMGSFRSVENQDLDLVVSPPHSGDKEAAASSGGSSDISPPPFGDLHPPPIGDVTSPLIGGNGAPDIVDTSSPPNGDPALVMLPPPPAGFTDSPEKESLQGEVLLEHQNNFLGEVLFKHQNNFLGEVLL